MTSWAIERGVDLAGFRVARPSLEDIYLAIIGDGATADEEVPA